MKFMTWTLHSPGDYIFNDYAKLKAGEPWYSDKWEIINPEAPKKWDYRKRNFLEMIQLHTDKFYSIGLHDFGVDLDGRVRATATFTHESKNYALNDDKTDIARPCNKSLCYLMHTYPQIKWCLQFLCTNERVPEVLLNKEKQDVFLEDCYKITELYKAKGFPIRGVEIDFEYTWYGSGVTEANAYRDLLSRIKNEVCLPLGMELRINMFAMTGDFTPSWYAWHDYRTLASAKDKFGNQAVDEFQMMSYDFSWGGSAPGPSTPIWWLKEILEHVKTALPPDKTFIGNAGYGRRWTLGEWDYVEDRIRWGTTLDYKQLMLLQNGTFIHNSGLDDPDGNFYFNDQDFIPFCGFNDLASDYIITYPHVYDKFKMSPNGGATFVNMNMGTTEDYVTKYSTEQLPIFKGVITTVNSASEEIGKVDKLGTYNIPLGIVGLPQEMGFNGYCISNKGGTPEGFETSEYPFNKVRYNFTASGNYRLIALLNFPFYDSPELKLSLNGTTITASLQHEWYPAVQKRHFYDLGVQSFSGTNTIEVAYNENSESCQIYGFVICQDFENNFTGGRIQLPTNIVPFKKRGETKKDGCSEIINAQFPKKLKVVGEIIRRPPRPAIIWEDVFGSYDTSEKDEIFGDYLPDVSTGFKYYVKADNGGFSKGIWKVYKNPPEDYSFAYCSTTGNSQLLLDKTFSTNLICDIECMGEGKSAQYGVRIATEKGNSNSGYLVLLNFSEKRIQLIKENYGSREVLYYVSMGSGFQQLHETRIKLKVFILNGKLTLAVNDIVYIKEYVLSVSARSMGMYISNGSVRLYKYNISSLDRWERMERLQVKIDNNIFDYGEVERNCSVDKYGYLIYTGYPYEFKGDFPNQNITLTQIKEEYSWENDYTNLKFCDYSSWIGDKTIEIISSDAGIWYKTIYIGDDEGMSVSYNSDRVGFIKTVNMINDYNCKGIAMWTLGQEDPSIYSYLP